jgi:hypothetical protein
LECGREAQTPGPSGSTIRREAPGKRCPANSFGRHRLGSDEGHDPSTHPQHIDKGATMWWFWWFLIGALAVLAVISVTIYTVVKNRKEEKIFDE